MLSFLPIEAPVISTQLCYADDAEDVLSNKGSQIWISGD